MSSGRKLTVSRYLSGVDGLSLTGSTHGFAAGLLGLKYTMSLYSTIASADFDSRICGLEGSVQLLMTLQQGVSLL